MSETGSIINPYDQSYWEKRWQDHETGWDIGYASTPIKTYVDGLRNLDMRILIPGCGNAWEGEYLFNKGFRNVYLLDIAPTAVKHVQSRIPSFPKTNILIDDFFAINDQFDLIVEQTFFCALHPSMRADYAKNAHRLLKPGGKLVGLLFDTDFGNNHPPFGGCKDEYLEYFADHFHIEHFERAHNSIPPRAGSELFIELARKDNAESDGV